MSYEYMMGMGIDWSGLPTIAGEKDIGKPCSEVPEGTNETFFEGIYGEDLAIQLGCVKTGRAIMGGSRMNPSYQGILCCPPDIRQRMQAAQESERIARCGAADQRILRIDSTNLTAISLSEQSGCRRIPRAADDDRSTTIFCCPPREQQLLTSSFMPSPPSQPVSIGPSTSQAQQALLLAQQLQAQQAPPAVTEPTTSTPSTATTEPVVTNGQTQLAMDQPIPWKWIAITAIGVGALALLLKR
jgi:hypothetical protein